MNLLFISCKNKGKQQADKGIIKEQPSILQNPGNFSSEQSLRDAAISGNFQKVKEEVLKNVNINALDQDGRTALMYASFNGYTDIVRFLLEHGADVDLSDYLGRTALLFASSGAFPETVKLLLDHNADPNIADKPEKYTPLMFAAAEGHLEVVKILIKYKADPNLKDKDNDDAEIFARQNGHIQVADFLKSVMK